MMVFEALGLTGADWGFGQTRPGRTLTGALGRGLLYSPAPTAPDEAIPAQSAERCGVLTPDPSRGGGGGHG